MEKDKIREIEFNFISDILRGLTHDLKNDIAVIKESSGFMEDIIMFHKNELSSYTGKQLEALRVVNDTVNLIDVKLKALNRFAHGITNDFNEFDLYQCAQELLAIISKFLKRHKIKINFTGEEGLLIFNNPFYIQYAFYKIILYFKESFNYDFLINIDISLENNKILIVFTPQAFNSSAFNANLSHLPEIENEIINLSGFDILKIDTNYAISLGICLKETK